MELLAAASMLAIALITWRSAVQGLGIWLLVLVIHGLLVLALGPAATHLPMLLGASVATAILLNGAWVGVPRRFLAVFASLLSVMVVAALQGIDYTASVRSLALYGKAFILALLLAGSLRSQGSVLTISRYLLLAVVIGALAAFYQKLTGTYTIDSLYVQRAAGLRGDPNDTAMIMVAGVPVSLYWIFHSKELWSRVLHTTAMALILLGIVLTSSRGGFVALSCVLLAIYTRAPSVRMTLVGAALLGGVLLFAPASYWERMETLVSGQEQHGSGSLRERWNLQKGGLAIVGEHPVLGVGPGNFGMAFLQTTRGGLTTVNVDDGATGVAHNLHLEFFAENGLLGGLLLWCIFLMALQGFTRFDRIYVTEGPFGIGFALAVSLGGMLVAGLFLSQGKNSILWFLVGAGLACGGALNSPSALSGREAGVRRFDQILR